MERKYLLITVSVLGSFIFGVFGFVAVLQPETTVFKHFKLANDEAIKWFAMSFIALLIPFLEKISISGFGFNFMDEIRKTNDKIDQLEFIIKSQKTESREYLIKTFNEYINGLNEEERNSKLIELSKKYFNEMDIPVPKVKYALNKWAETTKDKSIPRILDMTSSVNSDLIETLAFFQKRNNLKNSDGVFGYYTCEKLKPFMD